MKCTQQVHPQKQRRLVVTRCWEEPNCVGGFGVSFWCHANVMETTVMTHL